MAQVYLGTRPMQSILALLGVETETPACEPDIERAFLALAPGGKRRRSDALTQNSAPCLPAAPSHSAQTAPIPVAASHLTQTAPIPVAPRIFD